jgi:hypothetical protein
MIIHLAYIYANIRKKVESAKLKVKSAQKKTTQIALRGR